MEFESFFNFGLQLVIGLMFLSDSPKISKLGLFFILLIMYSRVENIHESKKTEDYISKEAVRITHESKKT